MSSGSESTLDSIQIPEPQRQAVYDAIKRGRYSLLLGSGFSRSATSPGGRKLPLGAGLAEELASQFGLPPQYSLGQLTAAIEQGALHEYFRERFSSCVPHSATRLISSFVWRSIYTLNVDDCLWHCYEDQSALQTIEEVSLRHPYDRPEDPNVVQVVYLHGSVRQDKPEYVFSAKEYGETLSKDSIWFRIFADELTTQPFIIVGCAMSEPDLEFYLARRRDYPADSEQVAPSLYVTDVIDPVVEALCKRFGLIPVVMKADDFWTQLDKILARRLSPLDLYRPHGPVSGIFGANATEKAQRIFLRQWLLVEPDSIPEPVGKHVPLLRGIEPTLWAIAHNEDVLRKDTSEIISQISGWLSAPDRGTGFAVLQSAAGEGKSSALLRSAYEIARLNHAVFLYRAQERIVEEAVVECLRALHQPVVLVVDQLRIHSRQVSGIVKVIQSERLPCFVLAADRHQALAGATSDFAGLSRQNLSLSCLKGSECQAIASRMRSEGLLGMNASQNDSTLARKMQGKQLIAAVVESSGGALQFERILKGEFEALDDDSKRIYSIVACAHSHGLSLKVSVLHRASSLNSTAAMVALRNLRGIVVRLPPTEEYVQCRHRIVAESVLDSLSRDQKYGVLVALAKGLAPYVNRRTVMQGTAEARLAGRLLDYDDGVRPMLGDQSGAFYEEIKESWEWNSRYWEQRALQVVAHDPQLALTFCQHAVGIETHPHTLTTLAKVEFEVAAFGSNGSAAEQHVLSAMKHIKEAIEASRYRKRMEVHPFDIGVRGVVKYCRSADLAGRLADYSGIEKWVLNLLTVAEREFGPIQRKILSGIWDRKCDLSA